MSQVFNHENPVGMSKYIERFKRLEGSNLMTLRGDQLLVERLPKIEIRTSSGLILPGKAGTYKETATDSTTEFGVVLMTGPGQTFEDGTLCPCDAKVGDVILLPGNVAWYSAFGALKDYEQYSIGRLRDSQIGMWFTNYKEAFEVLNG